MEKLMINVDLLQILSYTHEIIEITAFYHTTNLLSGSTSWHACIKLLQAKMTSVRIHVKNNDDVQWRVMMKY